MYSASFVRNVLAGMDDGCDAENEGRGEERGYGSSSDESLLMSDTGHITGQGPGGIVMRA